MFDVNPETCELVESPDGKLTRKSAALLAFHLAGEKVNRWAEVRNEAWTVYEAESHKATASGLL